MFTQDQMLSKLDNNEAILDRVDYYDVDYDEDGNVQDVGAYRLGYVGLVEGVDGWVAIDCFNSIINEIFSSYEDAYDFLKEPYL